MFELLIFLVEIDKFSPTGNQYAQTIVLEYEEFSSLEKCETEMEAAISYFRLQGYWLTEDKSVLCKPPAI